MQLNTTPLSPSDKPCIRDYAELITHVIPEQIAQLVPLAELERRCNEVARTQPRFRQETPLLLRTETIRRARLAGPYLASIPPYELPSSRSHQLPEPTRC
jgi:hypothetical protein